jgi:hypothetical protein
MEWWSAPLTSRKSRDPHLHPLAAEGHALGPQAPALARSLGQRAVGADHAPPGEVGVVALEEDRAGEAGGAGGDVAVGADEAGWYLSHAGEDFERSGFRRGSQVAGPKASTMRLWYSESSSGEMK